MGDLSGVCVICGRNLASLTCMLCGALACEKCSQGGACKRCKVGKMGGSNAPKVMR
ncbi:orotate phosphoribosyltransferase [Candidatus Micrarchaeota archaeon]|nr:orotate phosphoribosyltransferase [Candidatus Micrarchaeota archaeon]